MIKSKKESIKKDMSWIDILNDTYVNFQDTLIKKNLIASVFQEAFYDNGSFIVNNLKDVFTTKMYDKYIRMLDELYKYGCLNDNSIKVYSDILFNAVANYIWRYRGRDVYATLKDQNFKKIKATDDSTDVYTKIDINIGDFNLELAELLAQDDHFNETILKTIRYAVNYGYGCIHTVGGKFTSIHPSFVFRSNTSGGIIHILFVKDKVIVCGDSNFLSSRLNKKISGDKYAIIIYSSFNVIESIETSNFPCVIELMAPFGGCGFNILDTYSITKFLLNKTINAADLAILPPIVTDPDLRKQATKDNLKGGDVLSSPRIEGDPNTRNFVNTRPDIGEGLLNAFKEQTARAFYLDRIYTQNGPSELITNWSSSFFDGFLIKLLNVYFGKDGDGGFLLRKYGLKIEDISFSASGNYKKMLLDIGVVDAEYLVKILSMFVQLDPNVSLIIKPENIIEDLFTNYVPNDWYTSKTELQKRIQNYIKQQQAKASQQDVTN